MNFKNILLTAFTLILILTTLCSCNEKKQSSDDHAETNVELPKLDGISLDGGYTLEFDKDTLEYNITLPAGRPRIPKITATANENFTLEVYQAVIPDSSKSGYAEIRLTDGEATAVYKVNMTKDEACGFRLQFDDRYAFTPQYELKAGEKITYESSDPAVISVNSDGYVTALKVSSVPVTVTAKVNGNTVDSLKIDMIEKAQVNLFFIMGQSNAQGCYDYTDKDEKNAQRELIDLPATQGQVYSYDIYPRDNEAPSDRLYDMTQYKRAGMAAPLGKTWYEKTGEKTVFLQTAYSGSPIESWLDTKRHDEGGNYGSAGNFYYNTKKAYMKLTKLLSDDKYEINRRYGFWLQGETSMAHDYDKKTSNYKTTESGGLKFTSTPAMTAEKYCNYFTMMYSDMQEDFGIDFMGILLARALKTVSSEKNQSLGLLTDLVPVRVAQYTLHNTHSDIAIVSRVCDIATTEQNGNKNSEGYGYMGPKELHYNQIGHNANGIEAALNTVKLMTSGEKSVAEIEMLKPDGRTRIKDGDQISLQQGKTQQIASVALPLSANLQITFSSSNPEIATVDKYGLITAAAKGKSTVTVTASDGLTRSVIINVW